MDDDIPGTGSRHVIDEKAYKTLFSVCERKESYRRIGLNG